MDFSWRLPDRSLMSLIVRETPQNFPLINAVQGVSPCTITV